MKKSYEDFQKKIETLNLKYGDCRALIDNFDEKFENEDLERMNEISLIDSQLNEEERNIYGS